MKLLEDVKPITELANAATEIVHSVAEQQRTILITEEGKAKAVLMDVASYERWRNALAMLKLIAQSEADVDAGRVVSQEAAFERAQQVLDELNRARASGNGG